MDSQDKFHKLFTVAFKYISSQSSYKKISLKEFLSLLSDLGESPLNAFKGFYGIYNKNIHRTIDWVNDPIKVNSYDIDFMKLKDSLYHRIPNNIISEYDFRIQGSEIYLPNNLHVMGNLVLAKTIRKTIPKNLRVDGDFYYGLFGTTNVPTKERLRIMIEENGGQVKGKIKII